MSTITASEVPETGFLKETRFLHLAGLLMPTNLLAETIRGIHQQLPGTAGKATAREGATTGTGTGTADAQPARAR